MKFASVNMFVQTRYIIKHSYYINTGETQSREHLKNPKLYTV